MSPLEFAEFLSRTRISETLRDGIYDFPVLIILHILSIGLFGGALALTDMRILGWALTGIPVSQVIDQFRLWKWIGFVSLLVTGILLTLSDPVEYHNNLMFWVSVLVLAIIGIDAAIFRNGVYRSVSEWDQVLPVPAPARAWAARSLILWIALVFIGRAIAFF
jgi:hypothetical protein